MGRIKYLSDSVPWHSLAQALQMLDERESINETGTNGIGSRQLHVSCWAISGHVSAQALFRPLSPHFTPPPLALEPPELGSSHAGRAQGRLPAAQRRTSSSARSRPLPGFRLSPAAPTTPARVPGPDSAQPRSPRRSPPGLRPALQPLGGYPLVPPAQRRRRAANRRLPHCGASRSGGLGPPAAGPPGPDARAQAEGAWLPARPPQSLPSPDPPGRPHFTSSPCASAA